MKRNADIGLFTEPSSFTPPIFCGALIGAELIYLKGVNSG